MTIFRNQQRAPKRVELAEIRRLAQAFVDAHDRRNPTSENATLGEEETLFNLRWRMDELAKSCGGEERTPA